MSDHDNINDDLSIVPEHDELASHRKMKRGTSVPVLDDVIEVRASGGVRFILVILTLGLLATGGAGYYFYDQGLQMQESLTNAQGRILQLQGRLNLVDESAEQSSMGLLERVDTNFTQIDLLWANYRNHTAALAEIDRFVEQAKGTITSMEGALSGHSKTLNETTAQLSNLQTRLETVSNNIAGMDDLDTQLSSIQVDLNGVITTVATLQNGLANRVNSTEQDIESINVYRLQLNQTLNAIQTRLNELQSLVGP
jgi:chromosome segregation ATPase